MLMILLSHLRQAGIRGFLADTNNQSFDALLEVEIDDDRRRFRVTEKGRAPYPSEVDQLDVRYSSSTKGATPLLVAPYVSESLGEALIQRGWSWADSAGNYDLRAKGLRLRQRVSSAPPPRPVRRSLPHGAGSLAIIRFLIRQLDQERVWRPTELAQIAHVTQPRASQVLARLRDSGLAARTPTGWHADREKLLDTFLADYRGPGGPEIRLYSLAEPLEVARGITERFGADPTLEIAISADVGPDLIAPWRRPSHVIIYASAPIDIADLELVQADGRGDANVLLRVPNDTSIFRFAPLEVEIGETSIRLADEAQMIWDLHELGGDDRMEAGEQLRRRLLSAS